MYYRIFKVFCTNSKQRNLQYLIKSFATRAKYSKGHENVKIGADMRKYYKDEDARKVLSTFPEKMMKKILKTPEGFFIADKNIAKVIAEHFIKVIEREGEADTIMEINPGPGLLTNELMNTKAKNLILYEGVKQFWPDLHRLHLKYPERVKLQFKTLTDLWKLSFQDKQDGRSRVYDLFNDVPKSKFEDDVKTWVIGAVGSTNFIKHLLMSLIFQMSIFSQFRCGMLLVLPPTLYIEVAIRTTPYTHLTCSRDVGCMVYRYTTVLFQILFEHEFITKVPRKAFLPWQHSQKVGFGSKLARIRIVDPDDFYLVKIIPRKNLYELCPTEHIVALWYFVRQCLVSRKNQIIPTLEKYVPGCGPRLITLNKNPSNDSETKSEWPELPKYTKPSQKMIQNDYYPRMTVFTQFGDLTPSQTLTLFSEFRSWPEYKQSPFLASLETTLLKYQTTGDELTIHDLAATDETVSEDAEK